MPDTRRQIRRRSSASVCSTISAVKRGRLKKLSSAIRSRAIVELELWIQRHSNEVALLGKVYSVFERSVRCSD